MAAKDRAGAVGRTGRKSLDQVSIPALGPIRSAPGQLKRLDREERRLIDAYQSEVIELDDLRERRQALEERRQTLRMVCLKR